jgi:hypothetical protein
VGGVILALAVLCFATSTLVRSISSLVHHRPPPRHPPPRPPPPPGTGVLPAAPASSPGTSAAEDAREVMVVSVK